MLMRIAILLGLASAVLSAAVAEEGSVSHVSDISDLSVVSDGSDTDREGKFWWPNVIVVSMWNTSCITDGGYQGWCFKDSECIFRGGEADGTCADEAQIPGVCCDMNEGGNKTISESGDHFINKGYPNSNNRSGTIVATLEPTPGTVQVKLVFEEFDISPPTDGDCSNDTFVFKGANSNIEVPVLCGYNTGQHMYIDVDNSEGPWELHLVTGDNDYDRKVKVVVHFLSVHDTNRAPFRCLQYYPEKEGKMCSFNYNAEGESMMLNNQKYPICFGYVSGYCDIAITATRLDLGDVDGNCEEDYVRVGCDLYCGDIADASIMANATGPITMFVSSDDDNVLQEEGFSATYMMMPCE